MKKGAYPKTVRQVDDFHLSNQCQKRENRKACWGGEREGGNSNDHPGVGRAKVVFGGEGRGERDRPQAFYLPLNRRVQGPVQEKENEVSRHRFPYKGVSPEMITWEKEKRGGG